MFALTFCKHYLHVEILSLVVVVPAFGKQKQAHKFEDNLDYILIARQPGLLREALPQYTLP